MPVAIGLATLIFAVAFVLVLTYKPDNIPVIALSSVVLISVCVPTFGPPGPVRLYAAVLSIAILLVAFSRASIRPGRGTANIALICLLVYQAGMQAATLRSDFAALAAINGVMAILVCLVARRINATQSTFLPPLLAVIVLFQLALGLSEAIGGLEAMWPRPDGSDRIESRPNSLAPWLPGRVLGSLAGPIPFGTLAGIAAIASAWMVLEKQKRHYWCMVAASLMMLVLSGTRSAVVATFVVILVWAIFRSPRSRSIKVTLTTLVAVILILSNDLIALFGFTEITTSESYRHRFGVMSSIANLLTRQGPWEVLLGNGGNASTLLGTGLVQDSGGVGVYDNQFVHTLASLGILGTLLLIAAIVFGARNTNSLGKLIICYAMIMFLSFDYLTWSVTTIPLLIACAGFQHRTSDIARHKNPSGDRTSFQLRRRTSQTQAG